MSGGDISDRRHAQRASVLLSATISDSAEPAKVVVRNLSRCGALLQGGQMPRTGARLIFGSNGISTSGSVVWTRDGRSGVRFDREVNYRQAFRSIAQPDRRSRPRSNRPGLRSKPLTEGEKLFMQRWAICGEAPLSD